jgi:cysteine synthase A
MIQKGIQEGDIDANTEVVEATSGNTGIAIASLGAALGFSVRIYMSDLCGEERRRMLCAYGAKVVITPGAEHTRGARERALDYCRRHPDSTFFLNQHANPNNGLAHETSTGPEIWEQTQGRLDAVVIGLGTSGTFDGLSRFFKQKNPDIRIIGFEPEASPVYSGGPQGKHAIIGIGPGFVTDNFKRSRENLDEIVTVSDRDAFEYARLVAEKEGLLVGPTSGAAVRVMAQLAHRTEFEGKTIVSFLYDTGERYLTTPGLFTGQGIEYAD